MYIYLIFFCAEFLQICTVTADFTSKKRKVSLEPQNYLFGKQQETEIP